ncbi:hypothetical protein [Bradyrhizobium sp. S3.2.12]|uniref:hypothetical protein n=1 Tax=Bradyrhizobium sp. S3.2.12 TaxID=3156387 RepID=UPI003395DBA3
MTKFHKARQIRPVSPLNLTPVYPKKALPCNHLTREGRCTAPRFRPSGQYAYPVRIVSFNPVEAWSRDATSEVADALARRAADTDAEVSSALQDFIAANATRRFDMQLALPLHWVA